MRIKTISLVVTLIGAFAVWANGAFACGPTTLCPVANFKCALSVAQVKSLADLNNPGEPSVLIGYLVFDASAIPTIFVQQNKNRVLNLTLPVVG